MEKKKHNVTTAAGAVAGIGALVAALAPVIGIPEDAVPYLVSVGTGIAGLAVAFGLFKTVDREKESGSDETEK